MAAARFSAMPLERYIAIFSSIHTLIETSSSRFICLLNIPHTHYITNIYTNVFTLVYIITQILKLIFTCYRLSCLKQKY